MWGEGRVEERCARVSRRRVKRCGDGMSISVKNPTE